MKLCFVSKWLDAVVFNWLKRIYHQCDAQSADSAEDRMSKVLREFRVKLEYYLYDTYAHIIIDQFFTVIVGNTSFSIKKKI